MLASSTSQHDHNILGSEKSSFRPFVSPHLSPPPLWKWNPTKHPTAHTEPSTLTATMSESRSIIPNKRPMTGQIVQQRTAPPTLLCNHCIKPLTRTCFLCACDCVFCEDCTYSHFERTSNCPACGTTLDENGFTELVVAEPNNTTTELAKTSLQALFTKRSASSSLPFSDLCYGLIRQIDVVKTSTKFILKQLLIDSTMQSRKAAHLVRCNEALKKEITQNKQKQGAQKLEHERAMADVQRRLEAREAELSGLHKELQSKGNTINQFQRLHGTNSMPPSRSGSHRHESMDASSNSKQNGRAFQGFMKQKEAQQRSAYQARGPGVLGKRLENSSSYSGHGFPNNGSAGQFGGSASNNITPIVAPRPFSSNSSTGSTGSVSNAPRIRDLSSRTGYSFTSTSARRPSGGSHGHINKRRRTPGTPNSGSTGHQPPLHHGMSPSTAFAMNSGEQSSRQQRNYFRS